MENMDYQILSEIRSAIDSIRKQLDYLEMRVEKLQQTMSSAYVDEAPIELDIIDGEDFYMDEPLKEEIVVGDSVDESIVELSEEQAEDFLDEISEDPVEDSFEESDEQQFEEIEEDLPEESSEVDDDLPGVFDEQPVAEEKEIHSHKKLPVIDAMAGRQSWRTDMPGTTVNDIRSAIALNDRLLFINYLFNEDPMAFQEAVVKINSMKTLDQVIDFLGAAYPEWDMESEVVYRFMMAVRRRVK